MRWGVYFGNELVSPRLRSPLTGRRDRLRHFCLLLLGACFSFRPSFSFRGPFLSLNSEIWRSFTLFFFFASLFLFCVSSLKSLVLSLSATALKRAVEPFIIERKYKRQSKATKRRGSSPELRSKRIEKAFVCVPLISGERETVALLRLGQITSRDEHKTEKEVK